MKTVTILQSDNYTLESHGNGWAYTLRDKARNRSLWLQDDDAAAFRDELEAHESANPHHSAEMLLGYMADNYSAVMDDD